MQTPAVTLRLKRFRRRFGITAPKVVVRSHLPWQWLLLSIVLFALFVGAVGWLMAQRYEAGTLVQEVEQLRQQLLAQREELNALRSTAGTGQNAASIERASQQQLLGKIRALEAQNVALKEDILLFERLIPAVGEGGAIRIENFRVVQESSGRYRYRLLFAYQSDKQAPDFRGHFQLVVDYVSSGQKGRLLLPDGREPNAEYRLELKHFLRREGVFELPGGATMKGAEVRVVQGGTLKSRQAAQL